MASSFRWGNTSSLTQEATDIGEGGYSGLSKEVVAEYKWPLRQVANYECHRQQANKENVQLHPHPTCASVIACCSQMLPYRWQVSSGTCYCKIEEGSNGFGEVTRSVGSSLGQLRLRCRERWRHSVQVMLD